MTLSDLGGLTVLSLRDPAAALRFLRGLQLPMQLRWMVLLLAVTLSTVVTFLLRQIFLGGIEGPEGSFYLSPMSMAGSQFLILIVAAWLITMVGRMMGGQGNFPDALLMIGWIELMLLGLQLAQIPIALVIPPLGALLTLVMIGLSVYLVVSMTKALHGFTSIIKVVMGFILTGFAAVMVLSILLTMLGIVPEVPL